MPQEIKNNFLQNFPDIESTFASNPGFIRRQRNEAWEQLRSIPLPIQRDEFWKYTPSFHIFNKPGAKNIEDVKTLAALPFSIPHIEGLTAYINNGIYSNGCDFPAAVSSPDFLFSSLSASVSSHRDFLEKHLNIYFPGDNSFFYKLNTAFWTDGILLSVPDNTRLDKPLNIVVIADGPQSRHQVRHLLCIGKNSKATVVFYSVNREGGVTFLNSVCETVLMEGAELSQVIIQEDSPSLSQIFLQQAEQKAGSSFSSVTITHQRGWVRNEMTVRLKEENCRTEMYGLYLADGKGLIDNHTCIIHDAPNCSSRELYKGVIDGKATAVFNGKIFVKQDAQQTDAYQSNKNMLLSEHAKIFSKPELEIYADDVRCSHGSANGRLDENSIFYLRSRGISEATARKALVKAFVSDIIDKIPVDSVKNNIAENLEKNLFH